ncbi:hypothetical protein ANRL3_02175 [Anaerolineae bacterium]|nr:hypothetical protein ANRL3_02175 [Anaerolineae bacterium]
MEALRVKTKLQQNGTLLLNNLPLRAGQAIEVIILIQPQPLPAAESYALRGTPVTYVEPFEPAEPNWEALA